MTKMFILVYITTLASISWSLVSNHPSFNIICVSLASKDLLGTIGIFKQTKDPWYIIEVMMKYSIELGLDNTIYIYTDNPNLMLKAANMLQEDWLHLYFQWCVAHA
jgi:hypothetical protein